ncbi:hypothetical protein TVAG_253660 [Trichomonas vaginalis G3]|uniref:Ankyrin repeat protein n=1 Tax=Trichomonas vaginalis (strain ATCC PRA-98 / G3) TaxID=412133 RepID=A2DMN3_TRIV3|nr:spectrin binding [Trichomonas vaginalis G3]EAY18254.1 hypothetical protein TVAG_253660 [Trichomonas vaginalis G3]KAI5541925.1 spectrin binding [Trichomonas vaginalis G3]|eukprot:XP_001579240.1 hypothetical protein [Trichomonas vaginalis G3]
MSSESRFQQRLVETIKTGKLEDFIALKVSKNEINTKLLPTENIIPVPKYSTKDTYFCPKEPTPLMLAVLCERDDIVKYILDNLEPKLEIKSNGFNAFHLSVLTKDHKCFDLLFSCQYYQEHVDEPIEIPAQTKKEFETIIIHPAVSCSNYYAVLALLSRPPEIKYPDKSRTSDEPFVYKSVDVNAVSQTGSTPLKISVHCRNTDMVCILKFFGASNTEPKESNAQDYLDMLVNKLKESNSQSKEKQLQEYEQIQKYMNEKDIYSDLNRIKIQCGFKQLDMDEEEEDYNDIPVAAAPTVNKYNENIVQSIAKSAKSHICHGNNCNREGTILYDVDGFYYCQVCYEKAKKR